MTTPPDEPREGRDPLPSYGSAPSYGSVPGPYAEGPPFAAGSAPAAVGPRRNGFGTASLVLGILGIILSILFAPVGIVLDILAIVFAALGIRRARRGEATNRGIAIGGLVTGIIGLIIGIIIVAFVATHRQAFTDLQHCAQHASTDTQRSHCVQQFRNDLFG
jgi:hypothetical protein